MSDLVKRLRESAKPSLGWEIHTEAADRIERLEEALRQIEVHHVDINRKVGRPESLSFTLAKARAVLQDDKP